MVNDMNAKERLQGLEAKLRERGVVDVKFFFDHTHKPLLTGAVLDVIDVLDAVVANRFDKAARFGDSVRTA
ncbi:hypothetical protein [Xanthomonas sp. D-109]|uniref:hypothetical protein n=1 Tax=Xanthomonas sp. D-109 TaxID=2821274 RepID=UPI001ADA3378|nr:hypothetical protein [Xanthomonas sp. D-109]MBO9882892.1 hypothetical protein [Xanthomonas sp. D-109]